MEQDFSSLSSMKARFCSDAILDLNCCGLYQRQRKREKNCDRGLVVDKHVHILRFRLQESMNNCSLLNMDQWINAQKERGTQEPKSLRSGICPYILPSSLFSFNSLVSLDLCSCIFDPPLDFPGFSSLKFLSLEDVWIKEKSLELLVSRSESLESLKVVHCTRLDVIRVHAPNLLSFHLQSEFSEIDLQGSTNIIKITIDWHYTQAPNSDLSWIIKGICGLKSLCLYGWSADEIYEDIPDFEFETLSRMYFHLKEFDIFLDTLSTSEALELVSFLKNFPYLEVLRIKVANPSELILEIYSMLKPVEGTDEEEGDRCIEEYWSKSRAWLVCLKTVEIESPFVDFAKDIAMVKLLLLNASALEVLNIKISPEKEEMAECNLMERLASFPKASSHAKIVFT